MDPLVPRSSALFLRSRTDRKIAGVCGGIAKAFDLSPDLVRAGVVLTGLFTSAPVFFLYLLAALVVPEDDGEAVEGQAPAELDWEHDALRVAYQAPIAPWSVGWRTWLGGIAAVYGGLFVAGLLFAAMILVAELLVGVAPAVSLGLLSTWMSVFLAAWPLVLLGGAAGILRRPYELTCSHTMLRIRRPLRGVHDLALRDVHEVKVDADSLSLHLTNGERLELPCPEDDMARDLLLEQIARGRDRALDFDAELQRASADRERLGQVLASRERSRE